MSKDEVKSFAEFGPYRSFRNGDLETYGFEFEGRKRNIQFFFDGRGLNRIEVNYYEGVDANQAADGFGEICEYLRREYGEIKANFVDQPKGVGCAKIATMATALVPEKKKLQIAPQEDKSELRPFSSYRSDIVMGTRVYSVVLYLDPANRESMPKVPSLLAKPQQ